MRVKFAAAEMRFPVVFTASDRRVGVDFRGYISGDPGETYMGPYEVTPTRETQTLHTGGYRMDGDVTVYPIPRNYGLITYNGFEITVS